MSKEPSTRELQVLCAAFADLGWQDLGSTHVSVRTGRPEERLFAINQYGAPLRARAILEVSFAEELPTGNHPGIPLHAGIYQRRHDVSCILHTHAISAIVVSAQREGLLMLSHHSAFFHGALQTHDFDVNGDAVRRTVADLGPCNAMLMRNHGLLVCGRTAGEAFVRMHLLHRACEIQLAAQATGVALQYLDTSVCQAIAAQADSLITRHAAVYWPWLVERFLSPIHQ